MGLPSSYIATLGLPQVSGILSSSFGLTSNRGYYVGSNDAVNKTLTLPAAPAQEDRIEIYGLGVGTDLMTINGNGNNVNWGDLSLPFSFTVAVRGAHLYLVFNTVDSTWTVTSDTVGVAFAESGAPIANSIIRTDQNGFSDINVIGGNAYVGRVNGNVITSIFNSTQILSASQVMNSATLTDVPGWSFALPVIGSFAFQVEMGLTKGGGTAVVGVSVNFSGSGSGLVQTAILAASSSVVTFGGNSSFNTSIDDSAGRNNGGPFPTVLKGGFTGGTAGTLSIQVRVVTGTVTVEAGSWARVWEGAPA